MMRTLLVALLLAMAGAASADVLSGTVTTTVRAAATAAPVVVYAEPLAGAAPARPAPPVALSQKKSCRRRTRPSRRACWPCRPARS